MVLVMIEKGTKGRTICIRFDEIFDQNIAHMNEFNLSKRRNFMNTADLIVEDLKYVLPRSHRLAMDILGVKFKIISTIEYPEDEFVEDVITKCITDETISIIQGYVNDNYDIELDKESSKAKNVNEEFQFTDHHAKIILQVGVAQRITIPLITDYIYNFNVINNDNLIFKIFYRILEIFQGEEIDLYNKILRMVESRLAATRYSDKVMWSYLENLSQDHNIMARDFSKKMITNIISKLELNRSPVSFLHSVINNLIRYKFTENFPVSYKPLNLNQTDSDGLSNFDKLEVNMTRSDEGIAIINKLTIRNEIKRLMESFGVRITKSELEYYKQNIVINKIQNNILFLFFAKYIGGYNNLNSCNLTEYVILCIILRKWLEQNGLSTLSKYITAVPEKYLERKAINKKQFLKKLFDSRKYNALLNSKYKFVIQNIVDSGVIIENIATLMASKFYHLPSYEEYLAGAEKVEINERIETITDEYLDFLTLI